MSWPTTKLANGIADVVRGVTFSQGDAVREPVTGYLPVLRAGNIAERLITDEDLVWVPESVVSKNQLLRKNDIVMCTSSGSASIVGKSAIAEDDFNGSWGAFNAVIRPSKNVQPKFLYFWLQSNDFRAWRNRQAKGANIQNIRHSDLATLEIPLPAPKEQSRIVELLDQADALRRLRREADAKAARILPALFLKMFGDPASNPMEWPVEPLSNVLTEVIRRNPSSAPETYFKYVDIAGVDGSSARISEIKHILGKDAPSRARQVVHQNDTLVSTVRPYLRATALAPKEMEGEIASTGFCVLRPKQKSGYAWLFQLTRQMWFTEQLNARARGASYPAVTDSDIYQLHVPIPNNATLLFQFDDKFEEIVKILDAIGNTAKQVDSIFEVVLQQAFNGQLTAQWRQAHMAELLVEMQQQARTLNLPMPKGLEALP
ncbi:MAG: restriction endonuclease subunit S [Burkholderiales bacterium]|nr:restriction endonuclease subunit S [Burkholderiales bacterium]